MEPLLETEPGRGESPLKGGPGRSEGEGGKRPLAEKGGLRTKRCDKLLRKTFLDNKYSISLLMSHAAVT